MILTGKMSWLQAAIGPMDAVCSTPRYCCIQDIIDAKSHRFIVTDGRHFIASTIEAAAYDAFLQKYCAESLSLRGVLVLLKRYKFFLTERNSIEMAVEECVYFGEGGAAEGSVNINDAIDMEKYVDWRDERMQSIFKGVCQPADAFRIDFRDVRGLVSGPGYEYIVDNFMEEYDYVLLDACEGAGSIEFESFKDRILSKTAHLIYGVDKSRLENCAVDGSNSYCSNSASFVDSQNSNCCSKIFVSADHLSSPAPRSNIWDARQGTTVDAMEPRSAAVLPNLQPRGNENYPGTRPSNVMAEIDANISSFISSQGLCDMKSIIGVESEEENEKTRAVVSKTYSTQSTGDKENALLPKKASDFYCAMQPSKIFTGSENNGRSLPLFLKKDRKNEDANDGGVASTALPGIGIKQMEGDNKQMTPRAERRTGRDKAQSCEKETERPGCKVICRKMAAEDIYSRDITCKDEACLSDAPEQAETPAHRRVYIHGHYYVESINYADMVPKYNKDQKLGVNEQVEDEAEKATLKIDCSPVKKGARKGRALHKRDGCEIETSCVVLEPWQAESTACERFHCVNAWNKTVAKNKSVKEASILKNVPLAAVVIEGGGAVKIDEISDLSKTDGTSNPSKTDGTSDLDKNPNAQSTKQSIDYMEDWADSSPCMKQYINFMEN